ncbi:MAG: FHA domain-containing protein [Ignavibacteria bacterium]|nr:FHA domain-containing protein [Ignavibacteria bacterium]
MPILSLRFRDIKIRDYPIVAGQILTIGRKHSNDIVIDNLEVSGSHARIESVATTFMLRDLGSTNGTFVNEQQVTLHNLRHNDVILIGKHKLLFEYPESIKAGSSARDDYDVAKTRIFNTNAYQGDMTQKPAGPPSEPLQEQSFFSRLLKKLFG